MERFFTAVIEVNLFSVSEIIQEINSTGSILANFCLGQLNVVHKQKCTRR